MDIEWHVRPGDTSVHLLHKLQEFMLETGHAPESFPDKIIFVSMFNDIASWESQKVQNRCQAQANEVATYSARFRPGYWCFRGPGSDKNWNCDEERPSHQFADGEWDKLALKMTGKLIISKHQVFKCSNMLQTGALKRIKEK